MKKLVLSAVALSALAIAPAHAIDAKYRAALERSGCTTENAGTTCDVHKTKAQNAASKKGKFGAFVGKYDVLDDNGKKFSVLDVTPSSVKIDGHLVEEPAIHGTTLIFRVQAMHGTLVTNQFGNWVNSGSNQVGSIARQK